MTTEVAVLNREAAAIAADSAVTLRDEAAQDETVYNSANKIFELSAHHPVAIMVHGQGAYGIIPWETIIKMYRSDLGSNHFKTVHDYAEDFLAYLQPFRSEFPTELQANYAWHAIETEILYMRRYLDDLVQGAKSDQVRMSAIQRHSRLIEYIKARIAELEKNRSYNSADQGAIGQLCDDVQQDWYVYLRQMLRDNVSVDDALVEATKSLAVESIRSVPLDGPSSGVVIVGFGDRQIYPAWSHFSVGAPFADRERHAHLGDLTIGLDRPVDIRAFAQDDMIYTFLNGIHPEYPQVLRGFVNDALMSFVQTLEAHASLHQLSGDFEPYFQEISRQRRDIVDRFQGSLERFLGSSHRDPFLSNVSGLPKEELAEIAETLVSLTSFKQRMTSGLESVGGPIDVALISKGDGLVWVKRKHYFDKKLNMRYFERNRSDDIVDLTRGSQTNEQKDS